MTAVGDFNASSDRASRSDRTAPIRRPLQPLSRSEIQKIATIVRQDTSFSEDTRFETIELLEPSEKLVCAFQPGTAFPRQARVNVFSATQIGVTRLVVSLVEGRIVSRSSFPDARPMIQLEQFFAIEGIVRADTPHCPR